MDAVLAQGQTSSLTKPGLLTHYNENCIVVYLSKQSKRQLLKDSGEGWDLVEV